MIHARRDYDRIQDPAGLIGEDEPVFIVRAQDKAFLPTLLAWCEAHDKLGGDKEMSCMVSCHAAIGLLWQAKHHSKVADMPTGAARTIDNSGRYTP